MKRKINIFILVAGIICSICSCGFNTDTSTETMPFSQEDQEKDSDTINSDFESINLNHTITKDFCEITVIKSLISHAVSDEKTGLDLKQKQDNVWIVLFGKMKNTSTSEMNFLSGFQAQILVDKKYTYPVEMALKDIKSIVPLKTIDFAIYAAVPEEVISSCETYDFQFGFNDNLDINLNNIEESIYKFQITGNIDEYGSVEQIQNFQTFVEYISSFISDNGYNKKFGIESTVTATTQKVTVEGCLRFVSDENIEVSICPSLDLLYGIYELGILTFKDDRSEYGVLKIRIRGDQKQNNTRYISAREITLKSNVGKITTGERAYDYGNIFVTDTFRFDPVDLSLEEVYSIVNGDDLEIILDIETLENEHTLLTYKCDNELKENILELIDIYRQLPNASLGK